MGDRKVRLAALAAKAGRTKKVDDDSNVPENDGPTEGDTSKPQTVSFRNYVPSDTKLENEDYDAEESPPKRQKRESVKSKSALEDALEQARAEAATSAAVAGGTSAAKSAEPSGVNAAPKKINWDLKRDIQSQISRLEKRTQKAIVEMLKERLEKEAAEQVRSDESDLD